MPAITEMRKTTVYYCARIAISKNCESILAFYATVDVK